MLFPPPPPPRSPPLPPPLFPLDDNSVGGAGGEDHHYSYNPSILIIAAIVAAAIIAAASIHLLLRSLSRSRSPHLIHHLSSSPSTSSPPSPPSDQDPRTVIDSLPLFSLSASTSKFPPPTSLDCAVCLSQFTLADELRLLPSCRHAFHSQCIDTWLKSNLSCPLCRSPIRPIPPPPPPAPPERTSRSESFRIEIGSVSRRTDESSSGRAPHVRSRSYSLGSSFEYVVEDEIEAVIARIRRRPEKPDLEEARPPRTAEVAEMVGGSQRSWLKDYVDRLASSASSSFSSLRFSQRGSHRFDSASTAAATGVDGGESGDLERNLHLHLEAEEQGEDDGVLGTFYRWIVGV